MVIHQSWKAGQMRIRREKGHTESGMGMPRNLPLCGEAISCTFLYMTCLILSVFLTEEVSYADS